MLRAFPESFVIKIGQIWMIPELFSILTIYVLNSFKNGIFTYHFFLASHSHIWCCICLSRMKMSKVGNQTNSQDPQAVNSRVFVGNLNTFQCSKTDVERMFQRYGRLAGKGLSDYLVSFDGWVNCFIYLSFHFYFYSLVVLVKFIFYVDDSVIAHVLMRGFRQFLGHIHRFYLKEVFRKKQYGASTMPKMSKLHLF